MYQMQVSENDYPYGMFVVSQALNQNPVYLP